MRFSTIVFASIVAACGIGAASARTSVDRTFTASTRECRDVRWSADLVRDYPGIGAACQSVEQRGGRIYVKLQGTVETVSRDGRQLKVDLKNGQALTLAMGATSVLYVGGIETPIASLYPGAKLIFYLPEDRLAAHFFADDSGTKSVAVPIVRDQVATLAALELPATGSSLPLVGWCAVSLIFIATGVTVYRMLR